MCDSLLNALDFKPDVDKITVIRENNAADASFILTTILSKLQADDAANICLVTLHNTFSHYQNIGRRFAFDLAKLSQEKRFKLIDPLTELVTNLFDKTPRTPEDIIKKLFCDILANVDELSCGKLCCVVIDDLSHLLDLGCDLRLVSRFMLGLVDLTSNKNISIVVNIHTSSGVDVLTNLLAYSADLTINVSALKTGRSRNVSGVLNIKRDKSHMYHFKLMEKEIRVFAPGRAII